MLTLLAGAAGIGAALGLLGGGGTVLTVPLLTPLLGVDTTHAVAMSLPIVAVAKLAGALTAWRRGTLVVAPTLVLAAATSSGAYPRGPGRPSAYLGHAEPVAGRHPDGRGGRHVAAIAPARRRTAAGAVAADGRRPRRRHDHRGRRCRRRLCDRAGPGALGGYPCRGPFRPRCWSSRSAPPAAHSVRRARRGARGTVAFVAGGGRAGRPRPAARAAVRFGGTLLRAFSVFLVLNAGYMIATH